MTYLEDNKLILVSAGGIIKFSKDPVEALKQLNPGTYELCFFDGYQEQFHYLQPAPSLQITKNYGEIDSYYNKVKQSWLIKQKDNKSLGVLFSGIQGTGKTFALKYIVNKLQEEMDTPVILINSNIPIDSNFYKIASSLDRCIFVLDEFEKTFPVTEDDMDSISSDIPVGVARTVRDGSSINKGHINYQTSFLTLLDGTVQNNHLWLFTSNGKVSKFLMARPGRIKYVFSFNKLDETIIQKFIDEKLIHQDKKEEVVSVIKKISTILNNFTFDILETIINEFNIFGVTDNSKNSILSSLNIGLEKSLSFSVSGLSLADGKELTEKFFSNFSFDTLEIPSYCLFGKDIYVRYMQFEFKFEDFINDFYPNLYSEVLVGVEDNIPALQLHGQEGGRNISFDKYISIALNGITISHTEFLEDSRLKIYFKEPHELTSKISNKLKSTIGIKTVKDADFNFDIIGLTLTKSNLNSLYEGVRKNLNLE